MKKTELLAITAVLVLTVGCGKKDAPAPATDSASPGTLTDGRDGQTYKTVKIGNQTWMAVNLNYQTESGSWCYENSADSCAKYGRLYNWNTANAACPKGWRLPSNDDWTELVIAAGSSGIGDKLKSKSGWGEPGEGSTGNGTDDYGFSALPGGYRDDRAGTFNYAGGGGYWWTATAADGGNAYQRGMDYINNFGASENNDDKSLGYSVRCLMGAPPEKSETESMTPDKRHIGTWHDAYNPPNDLTILEIGDTIKFELSVYRITTTTGTAKIENSKIVFVTDCNWSGTIVFNENSILLTVDKSGPELTSGTTFNFTIKADETKLQDPVYSDAEQFTDDRDGQTYKTVKIGTQTWMAENLNYQTKSGSWCYENSADSCNKYGRLYDWKTAITACPKGWHLPSQQEWNDLVRTAGGEEIAGKKLKSKSGWNDNEGKSGNGTDDYGFSALPGGYRNSVGGFNDVGESSSWWTATERYEGDNYAYDQSVNNIYDYVQEIGRNKSNVEYVRCVKE